ncbi:hypothetical protein ACSBPU_12960 [Parapusillimonas sp. JC17]
MPNEVNIGINGKQKTLKGWQATVVIICVLTMVGVGLLEIASAIYGGLL